MKCGLCEANTGINFGDSEITLCSSCFEQHNDKGAPKQAIEEKQQKQTQENAQLSPQTHKNSNHTQQTSSARKGRQQEPARANKLPDVETPVLSQIFYWFSALTMIGGIVLTIQLHPGDPGYGREWKTIAYYPSMIVFFSCFLSASFYAAIGLALKYLKTIAVNTSN